ncbi:hypothetical protein ACVWZV_005108 [Bradyrhizobium sp. GM5.1]
MSDKDKPVNPFGRGERTIIRPNPGGKLPPAPISQPPPGGGPAARPAYSPSPVPSPGTPGPTTILFARSTGLELRLRAGQPSSRGMDLDTRARPGAATLDAARAAVAR